MAGSPESLPLPEDPALAASASALNAAGYWAYVWDSSWRLAYLTDDLRLALGDTGPGTTAPLGTHIMGAENTRWAYTTTRGSTGPQGMPPEEFSQLGGYVLATTPGGRDGLRRVIDPELADLIDDLQPADPPPVWTVTNTFAFAGRFVGSFTTFIAIPDPEGGFAGFCAVPKPAAPMTQFTAAVAMADLSHLERMRVVEVADRHAAAILMADLEASSPLARRLSTAQYFAFIRRLVRAADEHIVAEGGIVGRHAGDGVVAFFLAETAGSESAAARCSIAASERLRQCLAEVAARSEIPPSEVSLRFGLHWGAMLYIGRVVTVGRSEVTALGDEMNEAARIEMCATGGRTLASKALIERLDRADADTLAIDSAHTTYTLLADLTTATDKARRDAPSIPVCNLSRA